MVANPNSQMTRILTGLGAEHLSSQVGGLIMKGEGIFQPTATTSFLLNQARKLISTDSRVLDLGCGWGILGLELKLEFRDRIEIFLSDQSENAVDATIHNCRVLGIEAECKQGSLFAPWSSSNTFDLIISDVSGISDELPNLELWFTGIPCETGIGGDKLTLQVIADSNKFLRNSNSTLLLPLISLANETKILRSMTDNFNEVNKLSEQSWFFGSVNEKDTLKMSKLMQEGFIRYGIQNNKYMATTSIYALRDPKMEVQNFN